MRIPDETYYQPWEHHERAELNSDDRMDRELEAQREANEREMRAQEAVLFEKEKQ